MRAHLPTCWGEEGRVEGGGGERGGGWKGERGGEG